ncbi:MAG TPA: hypothetical protein VHA75_21270 [Rugosimonospora sp.]|nr:hypothetical protein [Rugosimonospora sp.]
MFRSQTTAVVVGTVLFAAGAWCLHDAWEGRGKPTPRPLRPFTFW